MEKLKTILCVVLGIPIYFIYCTLIVMGVGIIVIILQFLLKYI